MTIQETLEEYLNTSIDNLLRLVEDYCWNPISINRVFILTDFNELKRTLILFISEAGVTR
ncbi:hypothetical protein DRF59_10360 [Chryseobacterium flavum]|uniref:Uncharacterized protein n=1 Tax=Chryseobacterium flavum TaxID=415851 RepID=A0A3D9CLX6_9FLAO|nr:hypothetical protein [Chryseobacterium flavum]REC66717.1 hypothetical protein DRF59_10360 [Chryseobacterium flavum]